MTLHRQAGRKDSVFGRTKLLWSFVVCLLLLTACLPEPEALSSTPTPTATITVTPTITATIIWFPATATFTSIPTRPVEPTQDFRPQVGETILEDSFVDKTLWQTAQTAAGSVAYGKEELTLAVKQARGTLISLRKTPQLANFYMEIDVQPSLCRDGDNYGLLIRSASTQDFYRLMLNCSGQVRLERVKGGKFVVLQDWMASGQLLPGGMMRTRIGVAAEGQELRIFLNGVFHFSIKDTVFSSGVVGVFARSAGDTPLTVSFSNLVVNGLGSRQPAVFSPTATPAPVRKPSVTPRK